MNRLSFYLKSPKKNYKNSEKIVQPTEKIIQPTEKTLQPTEKNPKITPEKIIQNPEPNLIEDEERISFLDFIREDPVVVAKYPKPDRPFYRKRNKKDKTLSKKKLSPMMIDSKKFLTLSRKNEKKKYGSFLEFFEDNKDTKTSATPIDQMEEASEALDWIQFIRKEEPKIPIEETIKAAVSPRMKKIASNPSIPGLNLSMNLQNTIRTIKESETSSKSETSMLSFLLDIDEDSVSQEQKQKNYFYHC